MSVISRHCPASASFLLYPRKQTSALPDKRTKTEARGKWKRRGVALYGDITADRGASVLWFTGELCSRPVAPPKHSILTTEHGCRRQ
jgi:hypothetical protein